MVLVSLSHKPSTAQRASDLAGYFADVKAGIGSCAAGLHDSQNAYGQVLGGDTAQAKTARSVFTYGGSNCTLASNQALTDFASYQVTESLASYNLDTADNDVITWSFDSTAVQTGHARRAQGDHPGGQDGRAGHAEDRPGDARQAAGRYRRDLDRREAGHGRDRRAPQPAGRGTAIVVKQTVVRFTWSH